ncbi:signal recognition particle subunit SRP19/SEC65 family protein [Vulcanisaeta thermophila]|uniref:signal recognition particle subunit SRP19/SEC65 family protein n=1 Tax=Vulcanisaeta thermophila TaxID=867917 RepID=UPI0008533B2E|nr:signal recognition particle subunit SRP19/SEC65 family protein [Vulcanisaeta thermophila]
MDRRGEWIIWTVYFDSTKSRRLGRKVPRGISVKSPSFDELVKAVERLGLKYEAYPDKKHPASWFEGPPGYVAVKIPEGKKKSVILKEIAKEIIRLRQEQQARGGGKP